MATFKQLRDDAYRNIHLSPSYHGEVVLLIRDLRFIDDVAAEAAAIAAAQAANSWLTCSISEAEEDPVINEGSFDRQESIWVQCCKDPAAVDKNSNPLGGIAQPRLADAVLRSVVRDPEQRPYFFEREVKNDSEVLWRLRFSRNIRGLVRGEI